MHLYSLIFDRDTHLTGLCDWCGEPKGPGHVCPVDIPDVLEDDYIGDLDDDELMLEDGEVS